MEKPGILQRRLYAEHRMVIAIDRLLNATTDSERKKRASGLVLGAIFAEVQIVTQFSCQGLLARDNTVRC